MTDFEKILHLIRFGLSFRKMTAETIIGWADRKIIEHTDNSLFLDLSTAGTTNKIIEFLSDKVVWNYNDKEIRMLILSFYKEYINLHQTIWLDIEKELIEYYNLIDKNDSNESLQDFLYYLSDDWHLRKEGFSATLTMPDYLIENLIEYNDYDKLKELLIGQGLAGYEL